jgi:alpha-mannosidase
MKKKKIYMIGNSHIDPVWFWNWDEGMQEAKATFSSALDRLNEYPDVCYTATSTVFLEWVEKIRPDLFEEIRQRVQEGRFELTGGWLVEPDCILPCGEAFVRQGLYGQRYLKERFGKTAHVASNVDSFGHCDTLPKILKQSGFSEYVFMRPRLDTPVFQWKSKDGSEILCISLPSEYTTWFYESTREALDLSIRSMEEHTDLSEMACCYGVGNHGGGPTVENIRTVQSLQKTEEYADYEISFGTYDEFFAQVQKEKDKLPCLTGPLEHVNEGCYNMDFRIKRMNRKAEERLLHTDFFLSMRAAMLGKWSQKQEELKHLWKTLLFNQFHDTLGGTTIKEARDEAVFQLSKVCADCKNIQALMMQDMVNAIDTRGEGFPIFLFSADGEAYHGSVSLELNWFCKDPLKLLNDKGEEILYQRIHTQAKTRNYNLGGRRGIVFQADIPAAGFTVYRAVIAPSAKCCNDDWSLDESDAYLLENEKIRVTFDRNTGYMASVYDKETNYEALKEPVKLSVWDDQRDTWGGEMEGQVFAEKKNIVFRLSSIEKVESGKVRQCIRAVYEAEGVLLEQRFYVCQGEKELQIENRLFFNRPWNMLKWCMPLQVENPVTHAESAYGITRRQQEHVKMPHSEFYMHRYVDIASPDGQGITLANNSRYSFGLNENRLELVLARSSMYAQGNNVNWYDPLETYDYADWGKIEFKLALLPHGRKNTAVEWNMLAKRLDEPYQYLMDHCHKGTLTLANYSMGRSLTDGVRLALIKKCEDDDSFIVRVEEILGIDHTADTSPAAVEFLGKRYEFVIGHDELKTLKITQDGRLTAVNLLEWE